MAVLYAGGGGQQGTLPFVGARNDSLDRRATRFATEREIHERIRVEQDLIHVARPAQGRPNRDCDSTRRTRNP